MVTVKDIPDSDTVNKPLSVWDSFVEASYIINRDFIISIGNVNLKTGYNKLELGSKHVIDVHVREYHILLQGTCYQIESNLSIPPPGYVNITLQFDELLNQSDIPPVCIYSRNISAHTQYAIN